MFRCRFVITSGMWQAWARIRSATYLPTVYRYLIPLLGTIKHHFPHVSMSDKNMLAYTENAEKGVKDIQTQIKPGAYLTKYFGSVLSNDDIKALVNDWQRRYSDAELCFARDPDEIVEIYRTGPRSCMSGDAEGYGTRVKGRYLHPCEVYGQPASDITMAYIKGKGGVSARCMIWEEKKTYSRIYGDGTLLQRELQALGYSQKAYGAHFDGAKLAKIPLTKNRFLMPYLDGYCQVLEKEDHFLIQSNRTQKKGERWLCCSNTCGYTQGVNTYECAECGESCDQNNAIEYEGSHYCPDCREEYFVICEKLSVWARRDDTQMVYVRHDVGRNKPDWHQQVWSQRAVARYAFPCPVEDAYFDRRYAVVHDGKTISLKALEAIQAATKKG